jgi:hypothetical protein
LGVTTPQWPPPSLDGPPSPLDDGEELREKVAAVNLDEIIASIPKPEMPPPDPDAERGDLRRFNQGRPVGSGPAFNTKHREAYTHDALIDFILAQPGASYREIGEAFGYSGQGIMLIMHSDAFKARYEMRRTEIVDPLVTAKISERLDMLASQSIEILSRKLETSEDGHFALKVLETTTRANGYGQPKAAAVNNQFVVHLPGPASSTNEWSSRFGPGGAPVLRARVEELSSEEAGGTPGAAYAPALPAE